MVHHRKILANAASGEQLPCDLAHQSCRFLETVRAIPLLEQLTSLLALRIVTGLTQAVVEVVKIGRLSMKHLRESGVLHL